MFDAVFVPTPRYVPTSWETIDIGEFVQYDPKFFIQVQIPEKQRLGLKCIRPKGNIPQPVGLSDYSYMFADCKMSSVDMTGWNFSNVHKMAGFFINCKKMKKVKCDRLDFRKADDFHRMFYNCDSLIDIDVNSWNLDEISITIEMFAECNKLRSCAISNWNAYKLDAATAMYENCRSLERIDLSGWDGSDLNVINRMFKGCIKLKYADIRFRNLKGLIDADRAFMDCGSLCEVLMPDLSESPDVTLYLTFDGCPLSVQPQIYKDYMERRSAINKTKSASSWG